MNFAECRDWLADPTRKDIEIYGSALGFLDTIEELEGRLKRAEAEVRALRAAWPDEDDDRAVNRFVFLGDDDGWFVEYAEDRSGPYPSRDHAIDAAAGIEREEVT